MVPVTTTVIPAAATESVNGIVCEIVLAAIPIDNNKPPIVAEGVMVATVLKYLTLVVVEALAGPVTTSVMARPSASVPAIVKVTPAKDAWTGDVNVTKCAKPSEVEVVVGAVAAPVLVKVWALNAVVDATAGVNGPNLIGRI
jgi:hypothetical protein